MDHNQMSETRDLRDSLEATAEQKTRMLQLYKFVDYGALLQAKIATYRRYMHTVFSAKAEVGQLFDMIFNRLPAELRDLVFYWLVRPVPASVNNRLLYGCPCSDYQWLLTFCDHVEDVCAIRWSGSRDAGLVGVTYEELIRHGLHAILGAELFVVDSEFIDFKKRPAIPQPRDTPTGRTSVWNIRILKRAYPLYSLEAHELQDLQDSIPHLRMRFPALKSVELHIHIPGVLSTLTHLLPMALTIVPKDIAKLFEALHLLHLVNCSITLDLPDLTTYHLHLIEWQGDGESHRAVWNKQVEDRS